MDANPNASTPGGAIFAASATMGMYPNIKPPDATTLLIARGTSGAAEGVREPSQASTTSRRAKPHRELTAAPAAKDDLSVNENVRTVARSAPAALLYSAVASMPPSMDSSSMTLYPQAGSVNCAYANVVNVTSDVGGRRYANKNSAHVATRGVKHGANGASALFVAAAIADVPKRNVRPSRAVRLTVSWSPSRRRFTVRAHTLLFSVALQQTSQVLLVVFRVSERQRRVRERAERLSFRPLARSLIIARLRNETRGGGGGEREDPRERYDRPGVREFEQGDGERCGRETPRGPHEHTSSLHLHGLLLVASAELHERAVRARLANREDDDGGDPGDVQIVYGMDARVKLHRDGVRESP
jgi:hypothetical protein